MGHQYAAIAFTDTVKKVQSEHNSRAGYASMEQGEDFNHLLSEREAEFIEARDSVYMASVSETNWPYVQHRGGPVGFLRVIDANTIGFADFRGNRQYISSGNFRNNNRVALILMDYPNRTRLKVLGHISTVAENDWEMLSRLEVADYRATVERGFLIHIDAFDWNCPQHITPRYTEDYIRQLIEPLENENQMLRATSSIQGTSAKPSIESTDLGEGTLPLVISGIRQLTPRVRAYELRDPDGHDLPKVAAGSHLEVPVRLGNGAVVSRHYSLCSNPLRRDLYEIAVLREDEGSGGSRAVHESYQLGNLLRCKQPANHFELYRDDHPAVLIAGGIGITPIKAMAHVLKARNLPFSIHYAGPNYREMAFRDYLKREFGERLSIYSSEEKQRMDMTRILADAPNTAVFYICGPNRLIEAFTEQAERQHITADRIRLERFSAVQDEQSRPVVVNLRRSDKKLEVRAEQSILDAILEAGVPAPFSCKTGNCKSCAVKVLDGTPKHRDACLSGTEKSEQQLMCPCVSRATSDHLTLDL